MGFKIGRIFILGMVSLLITTVLVQLEFVQTMISNAGSTNEAFMAAAWIICLIVIVLIDAVMS